MNGQPPGLRLVLEGQATGLLDALVAHWAAAGVDLPARRYVGPGAPGLQAFDCAQVVVSLGQVNLGTSEDHGLASPQIGAPAGLLIRYAQWSLQVLRDCAPASNDDGEPPAASVINEAGLDAMVDAGLLSQFVTNTAAYPPSWLGPGVVARAGAVVPIGPAGGIYGHEATVTFTAMDVQSPAVNP